MEQQPDLALKSLPHYVGTQQYYRVLGALVTEGVKYIMDNGYSWFVTDAIAVIKAHPDKRLRAEPFLVVRLKKTAENEANLIIDDGNDNVLYTQHYGFTDAKREPKLYFADNVLMLSSEY